MAGASLPSPTWRAGGAPSADLPNMAAAPLPLPLAARLWRPPRPSPPGPSPPCPCPRPRGEAAPHLSAMGRASGRLPAAAPLFYGALAALALLGVRDVLFLYEENRCSMTYMFEYPEYLVSRGEAARRGAAGPPQQVGGSPAAPSAAGGRRGGGLAGSREGRQGRGGAAAAPQAPDLPREAAAEVPLRASFPSRWAPAQSCPQLPVLLTEPLRDLLKNLPGSPESL